MDGIARCLVCGRVITDKDAVARLIGPDCARDHPDIVAAIESDSGVRAALVARQANEGNPDYARLLSVLRQPTERGPEEPGTHGDHQATGEL